MNRPWWLRALPDRIAASLYHRVLHDQRNRWRELYKDAQIRYAPDVTLRLEPEDRMHGQIAFLGWYEKDLSRHLAELAKNEKGLFVDVGANIGYFSLIWVSQAPEKNKAIAVEASPRVYPLLKENVSLNQFEDRIECLDIAAGREDSTITFDMGPKGETGWGGITQRMSDASTVTVNQRPLDDIIDERIRFLKIDVEGADTWVLQRAKNLLKSKAIDCIQFEHNIARAAKLGIDEEEPFRFLEKVGYEVDRKEGDHWAYPKEK